MSNPLGEALPLDEQIHHSRSRSARYHPLILQLYRLLPKPALSRAHARRMRIAFGSESQSAGRQRSASLKVEAERVNCRLPAHRRMPHTPSLLNTL